MDSSSPPPNELMELAAGLATADVVDALGTLVDHRVHINSLVGPPGNGPIIGPAVTISFLPTRSDLMDHQKHSLGPAIYRAVADHNPQGAVLVMASNGYSQTSLGGSTKLSRVRNLGMAGIVCDGLLRDFDELAEYPFSSYCTGEAIRAGRVDVQPYLADVPVAIGGVTVTPGDLIFADPTGVAVIPAHLGEEVLTLAQKIKAKAAAMLDMIAQEDPATVIEQGGKEPF